MPTKEASARARASRRKGHSFERFIANLLKPIYPDARRQPQSQIKHLKAIVARSGIPLSMTDVVAGPLAIECKHHKEKLNPLPVLEQAENDSAGTGLIPVAIIKRTNGPTLVYMSEPCMAMLKNGTRCFTKRDERDAVLGMDLNDWIEWLKSIAPPPPSAASETKAEG